MLSKQVVSTLETHSRGLNQRNERGLTLLQEAAMSGRRDDVEYLIAQEGIDLDVVTLERSYDHAFVERSTALQLAYDKKHYTIVTCLIKAGAQDVRRGRWCLVHRLVLDAKKLFDTSCLETLLKKNPSAVNARCQEGMTPLMLAAEEGLNYIVQILLLLCPDVNAKDALGETALWKVCKKIEERGDEDYDRFMIASWLIGRGALDVPVDEKYLIHRLVARCSFPHHVHLIEQLVKEQPALVRQKNRHGYTPLDHAHYHSTPWRHPFTYQNYVKMAEYLTLKQVELDVAVAEKQRVSSTPVEQPAVGLEPQQSIIIGQSQVKGTMFHSESEKTKSKKGVKTVVITRSEGFTPEDIASFNEGGEPWVFRSGL